MRCNISFQRIYKHRRCISRDCSMKHFSAFTYKQHFEEERIFQSPDPFNRFCWDSHAYLVPTIVNCDPDTVYQELNWGYYHISQEPDSSLQIWTTEDKSLSHAPSTLYYPFLNEYVYLIIDFCTKVPISVFITAGFEDIYVYMFAMKKGNLKIQRNDVDHKR